MGVMCSTSQCELRSTFPNLRVTNVIRIVTLYTLPPLESPTSSWMTRSQRSRRRDKGLYDRLVEGFFYYWEELTDREHEWQLVSFPHKIHDCVPRSRTSAMHTQHRLKSDTRVVVKYRYLYLYLSTIFSVRDVLDYLFGENSKYLYLIQSTW